MNTIPAYFPVHQRILDITATALCAPAVINAPQLLRATPQDFSASFILPVGLLVGTIVIAVPLYLGRRAFVLPACAIPALSLYLHLRTVFQLLDFGNAAVLLRNYLLGSSTLLLIHTACLVALLYVFLSDRKKQRLPAVVPNR